MKISVRDYRGVERADVELAPVALVAGMNEQGKSCLAQATRAALVGFAIPIPGLRKKDAKLLVRDGAESGHVKVEAGETTVTVAWPSAEVNVGETDETWCSAYAAGEQHVFDFDDRVRAKVFAGYLKTEPTREDLTAALTDAGYAGHAIDEAWGLVTGPLGWDGAYKRAREHTARLKGQWEGVTHEKYGSKKAETWMPEGLDQATAEAKLNELTDAIATAKAGHERAVGRRAVDESLLADLREQAAALPDLEEQERTALAEKERLQAAYKALAAKPRPSVPDEPLACPKCNAPLAIGKDGLVEVKKAPTKAQITKARKALEARDEAVQKAGDAYGAADDEYMRVREKASAARHAAGRLAALEAKAEGGASTEADVEAARARVQAAQDALARRRAWDRASDLHRQIAQNEKLVAILAPEGLRRRKLAEGLATFNRRLADLCKAASWPVVRFDETLQAHYGTRPLWAASKSGQWRARVVVQAAMAQIDGSAALVIDEADILDFRGRNALFALLNAAKLPALVCMTINKPDLVPDLEAVGMGRSYWVEAGVVEPIVKAQERAA